MGWKRNDDCDKDNPFSLSLRVDSTRLFLFTFFCYFPTFRSSFSSLSSSQLDPHSSHKRTIRQSPCTLTQSLQIYTLSITHPRSLSHIHISTMNSVKSSMKMNSPLPKDLAGEIIKSNRYPRAIHGALLYLFTEFTLLSDPCMPFLIFTSRRMQKGVQDSQLLHRQVSLHYLLLSSILLIHLGPGLYSGTSGRMSREKLWNE